MDFYLTIFIKKILVKVIIYLLIKHPMWLQRIIKLLLNFKLEWNGCQYLPLLINKYGKIWNLVSMNFCIIKESNMYNIFKCHVYKYFHNFMWPRLFLNAYKIYLQNNNKSFMKITYLQVYTFSFLSLSMLKCVMLIHMNL